MDDAELCRDVIREFVRRGSVAEQAGELHEAERVYREWMRLMPGEPRARYALSLLLLSQGRYEEGWQLYEARTEVPELAIVKPYGTTPDQTNTMTRPSRPG